MFWDTAINGFAAPLGPSIILLIWLPGLSGLGNSVEKFRMQDLATQDLVYRNRLTRVLEAGGLGCWCFI